MNAEQKRIDAQKKGIENWRLWGPYLAERAWGTVREDYSPDGMAWEYFDHDSGPCPVPIAGAKTVWGASVTRNKDAMDSPYGVFPLPVFSWMGLTDLWRGRMWGRDSAYHQGPVWAWLLGHYALAEFKVCGDTAKAQSRLELMRQHLFNAGLGTMSEVFDGAPPHLPRGCPAQAWSVACVLEAWWRLEKANQEQIVAFSQMTGV